ATVLASSGYAKTSTALSLLSKLGNEKENLVWQAIATSLSDLANAWKEQSGDVVAAIDKFRCELFQPILARYGFENDPADTVDTIELRSLAISTLADAGQQEVLSEYKRRFKPFLDSDDESLIPTDLRISIFAHAVRWGSEKEYRKILAVHRNPPSPAHKKAARIGLSSPRDPTLVKETLSMLLTSEVSNHEMASFGPTLRSHPTTARLYWNWFKDNYDEIVKKFEVFYLSSNVCAPISSFSTREDYEDVKAFFAGKKQAGYEQSLSQKLDAILSRIKWVERDSEDVEEWLRSKGYVL
ncbi:hypothetical protein JCM3765_006493, partial [Sporobolomyces pararoseus]